MNVDVLVIGGGPAGSTAAAAIARAGVRVSLIEPSDRTAPRVGESLLPGIIPILADIGVLAQIEAAGFQRKTGATHWRWGRTPKWDQWFSVADAYDAAWLVERARFDPILLRHAIACGVQRVTSPVASLQWESERLVGATLRDGSTIRARVVIDASGAAALVAQARGTREPIEGLRHEALWAHVVDAGRLPPPRHEQAWFLAAETHWIWMFPLAPTLTSVGVVRLHRAELTGTAADWDAIVQADPDLQAVLGPHARRIGPVRRERDWSYRVREVAGPGYMLVGDAAGFIDPVLSTGVHLAMHSGWHAAKTAIAIAQGGADETDALAGYAAHHRALFQDLLALVRYYYGLNRHAEDYFWASKRILVERGQPLSPKKAFVVLTSGLVGNLALDQMQARASARREREIVGDAATLDAPPAALRFFAIHLRAESIPADLYVIAEPSDPAAPALFRTRGMDIDAVAPRHGNDPISDPRFEPVLRFIGARLQALDDLDTGSLADRFARLRAPLAEALRSLPPPFALVRVFGE